MNIYHSISRVAVVAAVLFVGGVHASEGRFTQTVEALTAIVENPKAQAAMAAVGTSVGFKLVLVAGKWVWVQIVEEQNPTVLAIATGIGYAALSKSKEGCNVPGTIIAAGTHVLLKEGLKAVDTYAPSASKTVKSYMPTVLKSKTAQEISIVVVSLAAGYVFSGSPKKTG